MYWRLHRALLGERLDAALEWVAQQGDRCDVVQGGLRELSLPPSDIEGPALALTTLVDARSLSWDVSPGVFWDRQTFEVSHYLSALPEALPVLNRNGAFLTVGLLKRPPHWLEPRVFVRPNSGQKTFPGQVLQGTTTEEWRLNWRIWKNTYRLSDDTLCWCAPAHKLPSLEWRVWLGQGKVAAWSPYCWQGDAIPWAPLPESVARRAQELAQAPWQADFAYVADFVELQGDAVLLELNAASTSGWYQVPVSALMPALRNAAMSAYRLR